MLHKISTTCISSPVTQKVVSLFDGRVQFSGKDPVDNFLLSTYNQVCKMLAAQTTKSSTGSLTVDGWSTALEFTILGMTWHFFDENWRSKPVPNAMSETGPAFKSTEQLCCINEQFKRENSIIAQTLLAFTLSQVTTKRRSLCLATFSRTLLGPYVGSFTHLLCLLTIYLWMESLGRSTRAKWIGSLRISASTKR